MLKSAMRVAGVLTASAVASTLLSVPAFADGARQSNDAHRSVTTTTEISTSSVSMTPRAYRDAQRTIESTFQSAVNAAKAALRSALASATTPGARSTAHAQYLLAIVEATSQRDEALVSLGNPPQAAVTKRSQGPGRSSN